MLGELPKLFGKAFVIGFLLPAILGTFAAIQLMALFGVKIALPAAINVQASVGVVMLGLVIWFVAILLMALNTPIIRLLEGYVWQGPFLLFEQRCYERFDDLNRQKQELGARWSKAVQDGGQASAALRKSYGDVLRQLAQEFPHERRFVLPSRFGNALRAFEVYSEVVYGLDAITGWSRLSALIPGELKTQLDDAKAQVDFWVNIWFGTMVMLVLYACLALAGRSLPVFPFLPAAAMVVALLAAFFARQMVYGWGALVMSVFDLYRKDLADKMGLKLPRSVEKEREMWDLVGKMMIYRSADSAQKLTQFRKHEQDDGKG